MIDFAALRAAMVERQIAGRGVSDPALLAAMRKVPREAFVPEELRAYAYDDGPLSIAAGQTISQPYIVALMIEAAGVRGGDRVLEVGAGSGYAAAVLGEIAAEVIAVERHAELAESARKRLSDFGYSNVRIQTGDGSRGWGEAGPYDAILVAAAASSIRAELPQQLADGGRLVIPVGAPDGIQRLLRIVRHGNRFDETDLGGVRFVPLIAD